MVGSKRVVLVIWWVWMGENGLWWRVKKNGEDNIEGGREKKVAVNRETGSK